MTEENTPAELPDGDYAVVEMLGHRTMVGRISEVERFGGKLLQLEPLFNGNLMGPILTTAGSLYQLTPVSREAAAASSPTSLYQLPPALRRNVTVPMLPPAEDIDGDDGPDHLGGDLP